jgi:hypothetical protein
MDEMEKSAIEKKGDELVRRLIRDGILVTDEEGNILLDEKEQPTFTNAHIELSAFMDQHPWLGCEVSDEPVDSLSLSETTPVPAS